MVKERIILISREHFAFQFPGAILGKFLWYFKDQPETSNYVQLQGGQVLQPVICFTIFQICPPVIWVFIVE